jgi:pantoate--beta-alanine ligase
MKVIKSIWEMQQTAEKLHMEGKTIGLVPTMGFLHEAHLSLIRICRQKADIVVVSIFVNPTQFAPNEDYKRYPRDFQRDEGLCIQEGVTIIFYPTADTMYPADHITYVVSEKLAQKLCGQSRPIHFRGVTTVVAKLFNIIKPHVAIFGQKDAQQFLIIKRMVEDLNFDVKLIVCPIVREPDGLAMSSRNKYLNPRERDEAGVLSQALNTAKSLIKYGNLNTDDIMFKMRQIIASTPSAEIDYIAIVDFNNLEPVETIVPNTLIALAVYIGNTRLIDNILIDNLESVQTTGLA